MFDRIVSNPETLGGKPCIKGTRISVEFILELFAGGASQADILRGKRVVVVDDSIIRGTTSKKIVQMLRNAGATEVHMRISSPPTIGSCFYGVDTPERSKLLAACHDLDEMARII